MIEKMKTTVNNSFEGQLTMPKTTFWLVGALIFTLGIIYGLLLAPMTHGMTIGCNNVSQNDCVFGKDCDDEDEDEEE